MDEGVIQKSGRWLGGSLVGKKKIDVDEDEKSRSNQTERGCGVWIYICIVEEVSSR